MQEPKPPPKPGSEILAEKQRMFAEQEARRSKERPMNMKHQAHFANALLAKLESVPQPTGPARVTMNAPPPLVDDRIPGIEDPEPIGGCFSDITSDE